MRAPGMKTSAVEAARESKRARCGRGKEGPGDWIRCLQRLRWLLPMGLAFAALSAPAGAGRQSGLLPGLFPRTNEVSGWALKDVPKLFSGNQVFDYMDGAGEIPRSYGLRQLGSAKYARGSVVLEVAIFDMGDADNAFGYYSARSFLEHSPRSKAPERIIPLDHPAHLYAQVGVLTFWKGPYTVIVQPDTGTPDETALIHFARAVAAKVRAKGSPPNLLRRLPAGGMAANSARYLRGKSAFDMLFLFQPRDVFGAARGA